MYYRRIIEGLVKHYFPLTELFKLIVSCELWKYKQENRGNKINKKYRLLFLFSELLTVNPMVVVLSKIVKHGKGHTQMQINIRR